MTALPDPIAERSPEVPQSLPWVSITREMTFPAAHHFWVKDWSEQENWEAFGKTSNRQGHGHNYRIAVTLHGPVHPATGMVMNLTEVKKHLQTAIFNPLAFQHLNTQVKPFDHLQPTLENLAPFCWAQLQQALAVQAKSNPWQPDKAACRLIHLRLYEDWDMFVDYRNVLPSAYCPADPSDVPHEIVPMTESAATLPLVSTEVLFSRAYDFCASHRLENPALTDAENQALFGKCAYPNGHGHNYTLTVTLQGAPDPLTGMLIDMLELDTIVAQVLIDPMDHRHLNMDVPFLQGVNPTAENIVVACWNALDPHLPRHTKLYRLHLQETRNNAVAYYGPHHQQGLPWMPPV